MNQIFLSGHNKKVFVCLEKEELKKIEVERFENSQRISISKIDDEKQFEYLNSTFNHDLKYVESTKDEFMEAYNEVADILNSIEV